MYSLTSINLSALGGPMGSHEDVFDNWKKYFNKLKNAKNYAQKEYDDDFEKDIILVWENDPNSNFKIRSQDLGSRQYEIEEIKIED